MVITLKGERPWSLNTLYAGGHWSIRANESDRVHGLIREQCKGYKMLEGPVDIKITAYFKTQPLDSDNIVAKLYIDGLKGLVIHDDDMKWLRNVTTLSKVDKLRPRVEIDITYA